MTMKLTLSTYRKKGINAYLKVGDNYLYGKPATPQDAENAYKNKLHTVEIDLSTLPDGYYSYKEAGGADFNKSRYGWIKVIGGEIEDSGLGDPPLNLKLLPPLPALTGSDKQIAWAEKIRFDAMRWNYKHGWEFGEKDIAILPTEAKWWIDNRESAHSKVARLIGFDLSMAPFMD